MPCGLIGMVMKRRLHIMPTLGFRVASTTPPLYISLHPWLVLRSHRSSIDSHRNPPLSTWPSFSESVKAQMQERRASEICAASILCCPYYCCADMKRAQKGCMVRAGDDLHVYTHTQYVVLRSSLIDMYGSMPLAEFLMTLIPKL